MHRDELIAALEKATGPDRALDAAIYEALTGKCAHEHVMTVLGDGDGWGEVCSRCCEEEPDQVFKPVTASIDAALTLVPEGMQWRIDSHYNIAGVFEYLTCPESGPYCVEHEGEAPTPALAICIAALRAGGEG